MILTTWHKSGPTVEVIEGDSWPEWKAFLCAVRIAADASTMGLCTIRGLSQYDGGVAVCGWSECDKAYTIS